MNAIGKYKFYYIKYPYKHLHTTIKQYHVTSCDVNNKTRFNIFNITIYNCFKFQYT